MGSSLSFSSFTVVVLSLSGSTLFFGVERIGATGTRFKVGLVVVALLWYVDTSTVMSANLCVAFVFSWLGWAERSGGITPLRLEVLTLS